MFDTEPKVLFIHTGGTDAGGIEPRLRSLEERMARVETKLDDVATKSDLESLKTLIATKETQQTRWLVGVISGAAISLLAALAAVVAALIRTFTG